MLISFLIQLLRIIEITHEFVGNVAEMAQIKKCRLVIEKPEIRNF